VAVLIGGHGTTDRSSSIDRLDTGALGYAPDAVVRASYRGGRTPAGPATGPLAGIPASSYDAAASQDDLFVAAAHLRALLASIADVRPGVPIDVYAHSQGGVVIQLALTGLVEGPPVPDEVDLVATLGSPHEGTDIATAVTAVRGEPGGSQLLQAAAEAVDLELSPEATAVGQLSEASELMDDLADQPRPQGVRLLTIGARGDVTVPAGHTRLWDAPNVVIDRFGRSAHGDLPAAPETTRELQLALAGLPPTCTSPVNAAVDALTDEGISYGQDALGFALWQSLP
jgi:hypothetical protein